MSDEQENVAEQEKPRKTIFYKIEYPFNAIDSTLHYVVRAIAEQSGALVARQSLTSGSAIHTVIYPEFKVNFTLHALDTRLCALHISVPDDGTVTDAQLRKLAADVAANHETFVSEMEYADVLLSSDRARGGRDTWPEDAEAIARLQSGHDRAMVKRDWLKHATNNRKRKKIADPNNRFRQLVLKANRS